MKVALVHDFLLEYGGAERVLEVLHEMYPKAPLYTAMVDLPRMGILGERFRDWEIRTSFMQKHWMTRRFYSPLRFMAPLVWESFNFDQYDVVISSSSWYITHGIVTRPETRHVCYLHTVPRYLYGYKTKMNWQKHWPTRWYGKIVGVGLRKYDYLAAQRVDEFVANSKFTAWRIEKYYRRKSRVIYPPVEVEGKYEGAKKKSGEYFLYVGRLVSSKHINLAIRAANNLRVPFKVVGEGPERRELESIAGGTVEFLGHVSDVELDQLYANARAFVFASEEEDFGIVPVEAMARGVPVVAFKSGGVPETVIQGKTGVLFSKLTLTSVAKAMQLVMGMKIKPEDCVRRARKFRKERFVEQMREVVGG